MATFEQLTKIVQEASTDLSISSEDFLSIVGAWWDALARKEK